MPGIAASTSDLWLSLVSAAVLFFLGLYGVRRAEGRTGKLFLAMSVSSAMVFVSAAGIVVAQGPHTKYFWFSVEVLALLLAVSAGNCFTLEYTFPGRWLNRRTLALFAVVPSVTLLLILSNPALVWRGLAIGPDGSVRATLSLAGTLVFVYAWGLGTINPVAFAWLFVRSPEHRAPAALMLAGQIAGRLLFLLYLAEPPSSSAVLLRLAVLMPWLGYAIAINLYRIFDPLPVAENLALEQMQQGMIVFDDKWRVASLNPAAARLLGISRATAGRTFVELLPGSPQLAQRLMDRDTGAVELTLTSGGEARSVALTLTPLRDGRGFGLGRLLMLSDVTDRRLVQARIVEQARTMAVIEERQRLAREIDDGLAQGLTEVFQQARSARIMLSQTDPACVSACLEGLTDLTRRAQGDVRERLLEECSGPSADRSFVARLREYALYFTRQHGIPVELVVPPDLDEAAAELAVEGDLFRTVQDALERARSSARVKCVRVDLALLGQQLRVAISGDGAGNAVGVGHDDQDGQRPASPLVESFGGSVPAISGQGEGTQVVVLALWRGQLAPVSPANGASPP